MLSILYFVFIDAAIFARLSVHILIVTLTRSFRRHPYTLYMYACMYVKPRRKLSTMLNYSDYLHRDLVPVNG